MRVIARLDIKSQNLIKGIQLEGLKVIGDPNIFALKYYEDGIDELILIDCVASLYGRNNLFGIIKEASKNVFVPITAGGGIRSIKDAEELFLSGADKVFLNTSAINNPQLINDLAKNFGSQAIVISIEAKFLKNNIWLAYTDNGREVTNKNVINWTKEAIDRGAGEILITSVDRDGTRQGFDLDLIKNICNVSSVPIIFSGGMGKASDILSVSKYGSCHAVAAGTILHYNETTVDEIKKIALKNNLKIRI